MLKTKPKACELVRSSRKIDFVAAPCTLNRNYSLHT